MKHKKLALALSLLLAFFVSANLATMARSHKKADESSAAKQETKNSENARSEKKAEKRTTRKEHKSRRVRNKESAQAENNPASSSTAANDADKAKAESPKPDHFTNPFAGLFGKHNTSTKNSNPAPTAADDRNHEGMVYVHGYTRKDGTKVEGYWRHKSHAHG